MFSAGLQQKAGKIHVESDRGAEAAIRSIDNLKLPQARFQNCYLQTRRHFGLAVFPCGPTSGLNHYQFVIQRGLVSDVKDRHWQSNVDVTSQRKFASLADQVGLILFQYWEVELSEGDDLCASLGFKIGASQQGVCNVTRSLVELRGFCVGKRFTHHHAPVQVRTRRIWKPPFIGPCDGGDANRRRSRRKHLHANVCINKHSDNAHAERYHLSLNISYREPS